MTDTTELDRLKQAAIDAGVIAKNAALAWEEAFKAAHRIKVGDILRTRDGAEAKVDAVYVQYGRAQHSAVLRKKDGSWGRRNVPWWAWEAEWRNAEVVGHE